MSETKVPTQTPKLPQVHDPDEDLPEGDAGDVGGASKAKAALDSKSASGAPPTVRMPKEKAGAQLGSRVTFDVPSEPGKVKTDNLPTIGGGSIEALIKEMKRKLGDATQQLETALAKAESAYQKAMSAAVKQKTAATEHLKEAEKMHDGSIVKAIVNILVIVLVCVVAALVAPVTGGASLIAAGIAAGALAMGLGQGLSALANVGFEKSAEKNAKAAATAEGEKADLDANVARTEKEFETAWANFQRQVGKFDQLLNSILESYSEIKKARASAFNFS